MFKRGAWVMVKVNEKDERVGIVAKVIGDGRYIVHFVEPDGTTTMRRDEVMEKDVTAGLVTTADRLRRATPGQIPVSRRPQSVA